MISSNELIESLTQKTKAKQAVWHLDAEGNFALELDKATVSVARLEDNSVELTLCDNQGRALLRTAGRERDALVVLLNAIDEYVNDTIERDVLSELKSDKVVGQTESPPLSPPPPPAPWLTDDQFQEAIKRIVGKWHLNFTTGSEDLEIDKDGKYWILKRSASGELTRRDERPKFIIRMSYFDFSTNECEISKVLSKDNRVWQNEVLTIHDDKLVGFVRHDNRRVEYKRC